VWVQQQVRLFVFFSEENSFVPFSWLTPFFFVTSPVFFFGALLTDFLRPFLLGFPAILRVLVCGV